MNATSRVALLVAALASFALTAFAQTPAPGTVRRPVESGTTNDRSTVVPDRFLRSWDPVTIFFGRDVGGAAGTPEDDPERWVTLEPDHPGAFTWLDPRTLQFRPADPWSPLERFTWTADGEARTLHTLMPPPMRTIPAAEASGLDPVEAITLVYRDPFAARDLARMVTVELRPLPGVGEAEDGTNAVRWLTHEDFEVKALERRSRSDPATFVLALESPIPAGTRAVVHQRLSLDDASDRSFTELTFTTVEPFRVTSVGTRSTRFPVTPAGSSYTADQAINGGSDERTVVVELSAAPSGVTPVAARNLVRLSPAVDDLEYTVAGQTLEIAGDFDWDTLYRVALNPIPLRDGRGRLLDLRGPSEVYVFFPRRPAYLRWRASRGVVERFGPQMVPVEGRGHDRFDLRIYPVDPLDRSFWPFPAQPVVVNEAKRPPGPGEAPAPFHEARHLGEPELREQLEALGSPPVSSMVELPLRKEGSSATFGLNLSEHLERLAPPRAPGHYLVGLRPLDASSQRQWMRLQVTDLSLTTSEHRGTIRLTVTSLATAKPVEGARVTIEGARHTDWVTLATGVTDSGGAYELPPFCDCQCSVMRISVTHGDDVLVLDARRPPDTFADNSWTADRRAWLHCPAARPAEENVSHVFTERPVYRPEEPVHVKGYARRRTDGRVVELPLDDTFVVVEGPGNLVWRYPVDMTAQGSFYQLFEESDRPTGAYSAHLEGRIRDRRNLPFFRSRKVSFKLEAYRLPRFEVDLHSPDRVALDREFEVSLTATYYAGGRVADRPVRWRVTQFPYTWRPAEREGFLFSSDARFSRHQRFEASAAIDREDRTGEEGSAVLVLNPAIEPTAQPRTYVVEATVLGADDQTVTSTRRVVALPPFVLGIKVPRYLERVSAVEPEILVLDGDGEPVAGQQVTVRLLHRQWHSYLRASDFSDGEARYVTDVVDEKVFETQVTSAGDASKVELPIDTAGVYVVELEARDRVGRTQTVAVDLYAGGEEPVTWSRPTSQVFEVETDRDRYDPGDTAVFVLKSPFQQAEALAIVETPDGNRYHWLPVRGGSATFRLPVEPTWVPRLPVHFVLMRGRLEGTGPLPGSTTDLGKPATLAATSWIRVEPRDNRLAVELEYPAKSLPGKTVEVTVRLADPDGRPLAGEVTLWLVDQAVLALGQEQRLDPLPDFITPVSSFLWIRDTRDLPFGELPFAENPGGGEGAKEKRGILDRATVRRNFQPVPHYDPAIRVGADGVATVTVQLPDNLTNFKLRAKAVSGLDRFGFGVGHLEVRLPVIVQPALPRFVRPGDAFVAAAIGRVVEGEGGPGAAELGVEGITLDGEARQDVVWIPNRPERIEFPVAVPTPRYDEQGRPEVTEAVFRVGVERLSDGATDAFEVRLPIRRDRRPIVRRGIHDLVAGQSVELPPVEGEARPGTVRRDVLISSQPALIRMAAGLSFLLDYPHGCTEQRLSRARSYLALEKFRDLLALRSSEADYQRAVHDVLQWVPETVDSNGLVAYWPGSRGYVSLTAWTLQFLVEAKEAGFDVDDELYGKLVASLERAMRSDYSFFIDGESFAERAWALTALTRAGRFNPAYAAELARQAQFLNLESTAQVLRSFVAAEQTGASLDELAERLWDGVVVRLHQGREIYGGLQKGSTHRNGLILPSETRSLAEVTRALAAHRSDQPRFQVLVDGLVTLGRGDGWGSTQANASALFALSEVLQAPATRGGERRVEITLSGGGRTLVLTSESPLAHFASALTGEGRAVLASGGGDGPPTVLRAETRWIPEADGSLVEAESRGFVVSRELQHVQEGDAPPRRLEIDHAGQVFDFTVGDVIEDHVQIVSPSQQFYVAVVVPLAAGMEPLNPRLATAPPEARPSGTLTTQPSYVAYLDDSVTFYYDSLPKGTHDFYFRVRANVPGTFIQPAALAEMMYDESVRGNSHGAKVVISP
ncbi:MAG: alpha-2-macroglobulin [bacterium]|nr:alpha-2-macroglobulin [bacterium]